MKQSELLIEYLKFKKIAIEQAELIDLNEIIKLFEVWLNLWMNTENEM